ncbi:F510_1955 family glycosylhydrolase [Gorillibacterium sp. sgz5001074]|uniref:F510_1955 family glycosylhydrolase n=1 Tax=Gorillibacterium sp. sgz5001074 TaxID=3446695 RepID=UPI003F6808C6
MKRRCAVWKFLAAGLTLFPGTIWADAAHGEAQTDAMGWRTYLLLAFLVLWIVFLAASFLPDTKSIRRSRSFRRLSWAALAGLVLMGSWNVWASRELKDSVTLQHIHGMGYTADGQKLLFAAHDGLKVLSGGHWSSGLGEKHDYMGFSVTDQGFYSSGHPAPGSKLKNPLGVVRSTDGGATLETLAYYGQIDFHLLAAGYKSHAVYLYNPAPQTGLKEPGLYLTTDDGKSWTRASGKGLGGEVTALAVHPDQPSVAAVGTVLGVYLSKDSGGSFEPLLTGKQITALSFAPDGTLLAGTYASNQAGLVRITVDSKQMKDIRLPALTGDAVAYAAVNPARPGEMSIATYNLQAYTSTDGGAAWTLILEKGKNP